MDGLIDLSTMLLIALVCGAIVLLAKFFSLTAPEVAIPPLSTIPRGGWKMIERIAAVVGILSFGIQIAQWIAPWLR